MCDAQPFSESMFTHTPIRLRTYTSCLTSALFLGQVFADLAHVKLDQRNLSEPIDLNEETDLRGSFGKVVKRTLHMEGSVSKTAPQPPPHLQRKNALITLLNACTA